MVDKVAMETVLDGLPRDMRMWINRQEVDALMQTYLLDDVQFYMPKQSRFLRRGTVNESDVVLMKIDSGCTQTTVRRDIIPGIVLKPETKKVLAHDGRALEHSLADINLTVGDKCFEIEVMIAADLAVPVSLGEDLPLEELINEGKDGKNPQIWQY